jgi:uncharacterized protein (TIGR02147 family)
MTENIYEYKNINEAINSLIESKNLNFRRVCEAAEIHASYFSRVMKGAGSFSQQQIFRIAHSLSLSAVETDYLFLLWQGQEAQNAEEKEFFKNKIRKIREAELKVLKQLGNAMPNIQEDRAKLEIYYSESVTAMVHMLLTIAEYRREPSKICKKIGVSEGKLEQELKKLESLNLIQRNKLEILSVQESIHLDEDSSLSFRNHINWRLKTIQNLEKQTPVGGDYHLSVAFTADEETKFRLKQVLRNAVIEAQKIVSDCKDNREIYYLTMDLFS